MIVVILFRVGGDIPLNSILCTGHVCLWLVILGTLPVWLARTKVGDFEQFSIVNKLQGLLLLLLLLLNVCHSNSGKWYHKGGVEWWLNCLR